MAEPECAPPLAAQRHEQILTELNRQGAVRASDLVALLGVSDMTIRRDIAALAARGLLTRVHGGAVEPRRSADEPSFAAKSSLRTEAKTAIAAAAVSLVRPGEAVGISSGTTAVAVARHLVELANLTVVTNSIPVAALLSSQGRDDLTLIVTGGERTPSAALAGPMAEAALAGLHTDWLFLGVHGITEDGKLTTPNASEAGTSRALMSMAERTVVVADSSKWGVHGMWTIATLVGVDVLISDTGLPPQAADEARHLVGELRLVKAGI